MEEKFDGFAAARRPKLSAFVTITDFKLDLPGVRIAFAQQPVAPLAAVLADQGLRQLHTAETEKYAHVTYFFNGGREEPFPGEERVLVPSAKVATYDLQPEMSAREVARGLVERTRAGAYDFAVVNFANPDMVGHTGVVAAAREAMEVTDECVGQVADAVLAAGGAMVLTADHGNAEQMTFPDGGVNTQHTTNPVPVVLIGAGLERTPLRDGELEDVAPTILGLLDLPVPDRMTGRSLTPGAP
jgi:2,3-bisphosphoglycerate-independent phosphoglycerate mutase